MSFTTKTILAFAGAITVSAHGHVSNIAAGGRSLPGFTPFNGINQLSSTSVAWGTTASDNGFVLPSGFGTRDIACHKGSKNAPASITVAAGGSMTLTWDTWPDSHKGPVINYLASCGAAGCSSVDPTALEFFKISEAGLVNGVWAADQLIKDGLKAQVTIPATIAPGSYVLRHEIIALHEGNRANGAQMYPQCINVEVTGSGTAKPAGVKATQLYKADDAGILFNIYNNPTSYPIPGPAVFSAGGAAAGGNNNNNAGAGNNAGTGNNNAGTGNNNAGTGNNNNNAGTGSNNNNQNTGNNNNGNTSVAKVFEQCGGFTDYKGPTSCTAGLTCVKQNDYYSQCLNTGSSSNTASNNTNNAVKNNTANKGSKNNANCQAPTARQIRREAREILRQMARDAALRRV